MTHPSENPTIPEPVQAEPVACSQCGHVVGEESDLLTIAYMSGVYDERKSRENGLRTRPTPDLAERIEGLAEIVAGFHAVAAPDSGQAGMTLDGYEVEILSAFFRTPAAISALKEVK